MPFCQVIAFPLGPLKECPHVLAKIIEGGGGAPICIVVSQRLTGKHDCSTIDERDSWKSDAPAFVEEYGEFEAEVVTCAAEFVVLLVDLLK